MSNPVCSSFIHDVLVCPSCILVLLHVVYVTRWVQIYGVGFQHPGLTLGQKRVFRCKQEGLEGNKSKNALCFINAFRVRTKVKPRARVREILRRRAACDFSLNVSLRFVRCGHLVLTHIIEPPHEFSAEGANGFRVSPFIDALRREVAFKINKGIVGPSSLP